ncbi:hypothetical protein IV500_02605 [Paeniglutamicibacter antarcticus]|uniref:Uncharacterized protein n=1 Tax=Arthrobacter terrae TaxID=2935737 RepID=A0A931CGU5_9MICC|nr:hypothetical protein [Arthrobacter terrae]MBG0738322.1 hypothetical protein [Arthrobacter terrae]
MTCEEDADIVNYAGRTIVGQAMEQIWNAETRLSLTALGMVAARHTALALVVAVAADTSTGPAHA